MGTPAETTNAPPSFEQVYASCFDLVWRLAAHRRVPAGQLDDAVQEVFVVIHRKLPEFEGRSSVRTWVAVIAKRTIRDFTRKRAHRASGEELPLLATDTPDPADALERRQALAVLDEALESMSEEQREAFLLCELEGMSSREVALETGTNDNTIRTRLRSARAVFTATVGRFEAKRRWRVGHG